MQDLFNEGQIIARSFYQRSSPVVATEILGKYLVRKIGKKLLVGKIIEAEAYLGKDDQASHSYVGKTKRNEILYGDAGFTYVHSIHRYHCLDIVTQTHDEPSSVLIRAIEPLMGVEMMKDSRGIDTEKGLTDGPGKICQALQITREQNGIDVTDPDSVLFVTDGEQISPDLIETSKRIGISKAKDMLLRYRIKI
jgi:DNA-3-methyladenine glycosylase